MTEDEIVDGFTDSMDVGLSKLQEMVMEREASPDVETADTPAARP